MRRRDLLFAGGGLLIPQAAVADTPVIANIQVGAPNKAEFLQAFTRGLSESGLQDGADYRVQSFWAAGNPALLPGLALDAVRMEPRVIIAGGSLAAFAVKSATNSIPVVFTTGDDPLAVGLVKSLSRPEANLTGVTRTAGSLVSKRFDLARRLISSFSRVGFLVNPLNQGSDQASRDFAEAAGVSGVTSFVYKAQSISGVNELMPSFHRDGVDCVIINQDPVFTFGIREIAAIMIRERLPAIYSYREFPDSGGLMSYGASFSSVYYTAGIYAAKIIRGTPLAALPIAQANSFELVVNARTARLLDVALTSEFSALADEVIE